MAGFFRSGYDFAINNKALSLAMILTTVYFLSNPWHEPYVPTAKERAEKGLLRPKKSP
jgi:hypothetical protein